MAKVKLDTMLDEVNCRLGNVVYSEWKGVKYVKKYKKSKDANSKAQREIRSAFSLTSSYWKPIPGAIKNAWEFHVKGKPLTGYNLFFKTNFDSIKNRKTLNIAKGNGVTAPWNMSSSINSTGEISVKYEKGADAVNVTLFIQKTGETDNNKILLVRADVPDVSMPVVLTGFDPSAEYTVYAVATDAPVNEAINVSDSAACTVTK